VGTHTARRRLPSTLAVYTRRVTERRLRRALFTSALSVALLIGCDGSSTPPSATDTPAPTANPPQRPGDGQLVVGVLVPREGAGVSIGSSIDLGTSLATAQINNAGGVNGVPLRVIKAEEPEDLDAARVSMDSLIAQGVDAIVGPTSSLNALALTTRATEAGVLVCSPTASSIGLDSVPDDGLFFRTVPSDTLQALAIAEAVDQSGANAVTVVHLDDEYGRDLAERTIDALRRTGIIVTAVVPTTGSSDDVDAAAESVVATDNSLIVVIADASIGPLIITSIDQRTDAAPSYVVNDAMRRPNADAVSYDSALAQRISGVSPVATPSDEFLSELRGLDATTNGPFAANAYDCLNLIALAAETSGSDQPRNMAGVFASLTTSGSACASFGDCMAALTSRRNFQYNGPGGVLDMGRQGDLVNALYELFTYDESGRDVARGRIAVPAL
jgi:branched-chain amino acid transport system substrate-binding protein